MNNYNKNKNKRILLFLTPLIVIFINSCSPKKEIAMTPVTPKLEPVYVMERVIKNQPEFQWFSARFTGNAVLQNKSHSISGTIRIKKDEAIYISLAPVLGIEIARTIITPDTLKFLNRLESSYYIGHIGFLNSMLHSSLDFEMLQSLLIGNDLPGYNTEAFTIEEKKEHLVLHDPERHSLVNPKGKQPLIFEQFLWVDPLNNQIKKNIISEPGTQRTISAEYNSYEQIQGEKIPVDINLLISDPANYANLSLKYLRINLNEPQQMIFNVPSRYEPIDF